MGEDVNRKHYDRGFIGLRGTGTFESYVDRYEEDFFDASFTICDGNNNISFYANGEDLSEQLEDLDTLVAAIRRHQDAVRDVMSKEIV